MRENFTEAELDLIGAAALLEDPVTIGRALSVAFGGLRLIAATEAADQLRGDRRARESHAGRPTFAVVRDESRVLETYQDGSWLERVADAEVTGDVIGAYPDDAA